MSETSDYIDMVLDAIETHHGSHGVLPEIVWVSADLHRQVVLLLPGVLSGVSICRSHTLQGISAASCFRAPVAEVPPGRTAHKRPRFVG